LRVAARRHLKAAQVLYAQDGAGLQPGCMAVAGYLFGLAGELAVKELMRDSGLKPLEDKDRHDDPFYAHFPTLKILLATASGRRAGELRKVSEDASLFQYWNIEINAKWVAAWKDCAEQLIERMETV
jgi:hypothetical protein